MAGVELLFGPMLVGVVLNLMLYGVVCTQIYAYFQRYPNDSAWIRYFMLYLLVVETANVVVEVGIIYQPLIIQYGQQAAVRLSPKLLPGDSILISIVSAPIQLFTAWRISVITESLILPAFISLLSLGSFAGGITVSVMVVLNPTFGSFVSFKTEIAVWLGLSAACDIVIAVGMSYALYTRKTGFGAIDGQINRIIRLTVETGALTAITALADVALFLAFPATTLNFIVDFPLSALYTCSILAMLNSRDRRKTTDVERVPNILTTDQTVKRPMSFQPSRKSQPPAGIYMHTATFAEKGKGHNVTVSQDTLVSDPPRPDFSTSTLNGSRAATPDILRTRTNSGADLVSLVSNPPQPDFYNYNGSGSPTTRPRKLSEGSSTTLSSLPPNARSLPSNPRPRRPTAPQPQQLALRPKTIIGPNRPLPERF